MVSAEVFCGVVPLTHRWREQIIRALPVFVVSRRHAVQIEHQLRLRELEPTPVVHCGVILDAAQLERQGNRLLIPLDRALDPELRQIILLLSVISGLTASCAHRCEFLAKDTLVWDFVCLFSFG